MGTRLYLIRHGAVPANHERLFIGDKDEDLTPKGRDEIRALAGALSGIRPHAILTSPLLRAQATANLLAEVCAGPIRTEPRLREQSFGDWEGRSFRDVTSSEAHRFFTDPDAAPPGGESLASVHHRVVDLVEEIAAAADGTTFFLVSHVGPIKTLLAEAMAVPLTTLRRFFLDTGTVSVIDWRQPPVVRLVNASPRHDWPAP